LKPILQDIHSTFLPKSFKSMPENITDCWVDIVASIGVAEADGGDYFTFQVCTTNRLERIIGSGEFLVVSKLIIVNKFDWELVETAVKSILENLEADTWEQLAAKIHEYGEWEFHDYQSEPL
jgi:Immunity protein 8